MRRIIMLGAFTLAAACALGAGAQAQRRPQIVLYQEDDYHGNQLTLDGEVSRLSDRHFDDRASSLKVISGSWQLCQEDDFRGRCVTVSKDVSRLNDIKMDDRISSIRPLAGQRRR